jgi:2-succinyl-5-enolpyruvyl-6-hydroxy-3-cyclohexene-1-carboxylate synthase
MSRDANSAFAHCLVDEWSRGGLTDVVLSPGSRSTPLALAFADHPGVRVHVHLDERSAGFFGLGLGKSSGRPAVVMCTSGTAAANLHPAVLESFHARVPMIVCTADRPPELREVGAGQSVDQNRLYGTAVRWFFEPDAPGDPLQPPSTWRWMAARAFAEAQGPPGGPVHLNLPFREPLVPIEGSRSRR